MPNYNDSLYDPPAPMVEVELRDRHTHATISIVPFLIDTGADVTLIPRSAVIGIKPTDELSYKLVGFDGTQSPAQSVEVELFFLNKTFRGKYLLVDSEHGVLGRNVLAKLVLLFDGLC